MKTFKMFTMETGEWTKSWGTKGISLLPFNEQLKKFVAIKIKSDCCLTYGIWG